MCQTSRYYTEPRTHNQKDKHHMFSLTWFQTLLYISLEVYVTVTKTNKQTNRNRNRPIGGRAKHLARGESQT